MLTKLFRLFIFFNYLKLFLCDGFRCNQLLNGDALYSLESLASANKFDFDLKLNQNQNSNFSQREVKTSEI